MSQIVYVDLSAKVEQWPQDSAVAVCNGLSRALVVRGRIKQQARQYVIDKYSSKSVQYRILAALVYLAIKDDLSQIRQIVIDRDYSGKSAEATIKNLLLALLRRDKPEVTAGFIRFANVKGSRADNLARQVYRGKVEAERVVSWAELSDIL